MKFQIGDHVECIFDTEWQIKHWRSDRKKEAILSKKRGKPIFFMGKAAAYMHLYESYEVVGFTKTGGVRLGGFTAPVSSKHLRLSTKPVREWRSDWWFVNYYKMLEEKDQK